jgi:hypothetical protein
MIWQWRKLWGAMETRKIDAFALRADSVPNMTAREEKSRQN